MGRVKTETDLRKELAVLQERYDALAHEVRQAVDAVEAGEHPKLIMRRLAAKVHAGNRRTWTDDDIITKAWEWRHKYGETPAATSWSPANLKRNAKGEGDPELMERWLDGEWPSTPTVQRRFGSWNAMIDRAELPRNELDRHLPKRAEGDLEHLPVWTGWEMIGSMRERAGIATPAELGRRAGVAWLTVANLERGRSQNPSLRVFLAVAVGLGVPPAALLEYRPGQRMYVGNDNEEQVNGGG